MIRSLRRRHRATAFLLALLLPAAFVASLAARPAPEPVPPDRVKSGLEVSLGLDAFGRLVLELDASGGPVIPDALVYWAPDASEERELPPGAVLLGALPQDAARRFSLPYPAREQRGVALVFSVAWHKRVAAFALDDMTTREASP